MDRLYFDYNASAPLATGLKQELAGWLEVDYKNPSSAHQDGQGAKALVEKSRKTILRLLGATSGDKLFFTSGGSESNNTVLNSAYLNRGSKKKLVLTRIEHSCVYNYARFLGTLGVELVWIDVDRHGNVNLADFAAKLTDDVFLACVMLANNETGFVLPVQEMTGLARQKGVPVLCDVVCAAGKIPFSFQDLGVDYMTFSSHKFGGLKGSGGIVYKSGAKLSPLIIGGPQEDEKRAGTQNVLGIAASAFALEKWCADLAADVTREENLRELLKDKIREAYSGALFIESKQHLPQTLNASFVGLNGNLLLTGLDLEGVSCSYGSACASGSLEVSRVMKELGLKFDEARAALRFSFGKATTRDDIEEFGRRLQRAVQRMN